MSRPALDPLLTLWPPRDAGSPVARVMIVPDEAGTVVVEEWEEVESKWVPVPTSAGGVDWTDKQKTVGHAHG